MGTYEKIENIGGEGMEAIITGYSAEDIKGMVEVWNEVIKAGDAFPQRECLDEESAAEFFGKQDFTAVAKVDGEVVGLYILHPNNVGRCGHMANSSYAVKGNLRGLKIGEKLVTHSLVKGKELGYRLLVFNAVVKENERAIRLYNKLGFVKVGEIPGGFQKKSGEYQDISIFYHTL